MNEIYKHIARELFTYGNVVNNTTELENFQFTLGDINDNMITLKSRNISKSYIIGELSWYFGGINSVDYISHFGNMWSRISDDGVTNNSAYGYVLQKEFGFNQIETIIELLKKDPNSRRAVLNINRANPNVITTKDEHCTIALVFSIRNNKLNCTGIMRSNDIWFGLPYDVIYFTELQKYIANKLNVEYGTYTHFATSLHVYEQYYDKLYDIAVDEEIIDLDLDLSLLHEGDTLKEINEYVINNFTTKEDFINKCKELHIDRS